MAPETLDLSVVIITYNEENNITACLSSLPPGCEIILLDSDSTDQTQALARSMGAHIHVRPFSHYAEQKNAAVALATRSWVLSLDADETLSEGLRADLVAFLQSPRAAQNGAYRLRRRLFFMNRIMKYGKTSDRPVRLFRRGHGEFVGKIHEAFTAKDPVQNFSSRGYLLHHSYGDLTDYFVRFNNYTSRIAQNHFEKRRTISFLPHVLRPMAEFVGRYFLRLGFLDGYAGYTYALLSSLYTYVKYAKLIEMQAKSVGSHPRESLS